MTKSGATLAASSRRTRTNHEASATTDSISSSHRTIDRAALRQQLIQHIQDEYQINSSEATRLLQEVTEEESRIESGPSTHGTQPPKSEANQLRKSSFRLCHVDTNAVAVEFASSSAATSSWTNFLITYLLSPVWLHLWIEGPTSIIMILYPWLVPLPQSSLESSFYLRGIGNVLFCLNVLLWRTRYEAHATSPTKRLVCQAARLYHIIAIILVLYHEWFESEPNHTISSTTISSLVIHSGLSMLF